MSADLKFSSQERFEALFLTEEGWIVIAAEINASGTTLQLTNFLVEPLDTKILRVGVRQLWIILRELEVSAKREGYTHLQILGVRMSGSNPNRSICYDRRLV